MSNSTIRLLILREIKKDSGVSIEGLSKQFGVSRSTVNRVVTVLKEENLIQRDGKRRAVYLTIKGHEYFNSFYPNVTAGSEPDL